MTIVILLVLVAFAYLVLRLIEFGLVKAWQLWRERSRGDEVIRVAGTSDDLPRPPRPQLKGKVPIEGDAQLGDASMDPGT